MFRRNNTKVDKKDAKSPDVWGRVPKLYVIRDTAKNRQRMFSSTHLQFSFSALFKKNEIENRNVVQIMVSGPSPDAVELDLI
jgi:hypothetical protein